MPLLSKFRSSFSEDPSLSVICVAAVVLRLSYFLATPHWIRGHDIEGHLDYVLFASKTLAVPPYNLGIEFYHPPIYYWIAGSVVRLMFAIDASLPQAFQAVQLLSLIWSIASFYLLLEIGKRLFAGSEDALGFYLYLATVAVFPGVVFFCARINNDVLAQLLCFLALLSLLVWLRDAQPRSWILFCLALSTALLVKATGLFVLFPALLILWFRPNLKWSEKWRLSLLCAFFIATSVGWFAEQRIREGQVNVVGNAFTLNSEKRIKPEDRKFLAFSPANVYQSVIEMPTSTLNGRGRFLEYYFRSAILSDRTHGTAIETYLLVLMVSALTVLPFVVLGFLLEFNYLLFDTKQGWITKTSFYPTFFCSALLLVLPLQYYFTTATPSQDFRYTSFTLISAAYFLGRSLRHLPKWLRVLQLFICSIFLVNCCMLPLLFYFN